MKSLQKRLHMITFACFELVSLQSSELNRAKRNVGEASK